MGRNYKERDKELKLREQTSLAIIKLARKFFYNTPVQRWRFTSFVYDTVFHAGYTEKELSTTYFGAKLTFPSRDFTITPGLVGGFYERFELELYQQICERSKRVVDVGGNIGLYTAVAGKAGCDVEVFEPVPENYKYLELNVKQNRLSKRIKTINKAVGAKSGKAKIYLAKKNIGTHSMSSGAAGSNESIEVDVITLDKYLTKKPAVDVLKIDVEGFDGYVLEGARGLLKSQSPTLFIELVPNHLEAAQYNPVHFVDLICEAYESVYLVDEVAEVVELATKEVLYKYVQANKNVNLISTSNSVHAEILSAAISS